MCLLFSLPSFKFQVQQVAWIALAMWSLSSPRCGPWLTGNSDMILGDKKKVPHPFSGGSLRVTDKHSLSERKEESLRNQQWHQSALTGI